MKKRTFIATIAVALIAGASIFVACTKEDSRNGYAKSDTDPISEEDCFTIGDQLENAYSVTNMQKAYDTLRAHGMTDIVDVHCTHLYVKFYPETPDNYHKLISDTTLDLFDFPLDHEIIGQGALCSKPDDYNVLYTVVPVNYDFPDVRHDILEYCFIPDENATEAEEKVEMESMILTGNLTPDDTVSTPPSNPDKRWNWFRLPAKKHPHGTFTVKNTETGSYDKLVNARIVSFRLVKISHTYTNDNGYYYQPKTFRWKCLYGVSFRNSNHFNIYSNLGPMAPAFYYIGRESNDTYNKDIESFSVAFPWATINNAACYYLKHIVPTENVTRPPYNLHIWSVPSLPTDFTGNAVMAYQMRPGFTSITPITNDFCLATIANSLSPSMGIILPDICILKPNVADTLLTRKYYQYTIHELSHASHFAQVGSPYWSQYVTATIANIGYGNDSTGWHGMNGVIGVGEMWGYFFEYWNMVNYINSLPNHWSAAINIKTSEWFKPKILDDLCHTDGLDITPKKILNCMTVDVTTVGALKERLKLNYGTYGRDIIIDSIFHCYGF